MTAARYLEFLVEEQSMEAFLRGLLPRLLPEGCTFEIRVFQGKRDLVRRLESRLRGYRNWLPDEYRLMVMVDCDRDDCRTLKARLEDAAAGSGLRTRSRAGGGRWQVVNRIVIEELEAWYFGDWEAVRDAFPRVSSTIPNKPRYGKPDAIPDTWEGFEYILKQHGYFRTGLRKIEAARAIAPKIDPARNRSPSFVAFRDALAEATA